jgi:hypothetical protein
MSIIQAFFYVYISITLPTAIAIGIYLRSKGITQDDVPREFTWW